MTKEALKLALEALEVANSCVDGYYIPKGKTHLPEIELASIAIKEALANEALDKMAENARELGLDYEPEQDWIERERAVGYREGHMAALAQRTWVNATTWRGLTDEEIKPCWYEACQTDLELTSQLVVYFAKAIEAKLKEKNVL